MAARDGKALHARLVAPPLHPMSRLRLTTIGLHDELTGSWRLAADLSSFARLFADGLGYRAQRVVNIGDHRRRRTVRFRDGTELSYRLNRGDVRAIAEVWIREAYKLPFEVHPRNVVDFGANIGAAGVWLVRRYGAARLVAVEPVRENADLARVNLARTGIETHVLTAAVASHEGTARFELSDNSALGKLGENRVEVPNGIEVPLVTPQAVIDRFPAGEAIDLVKMDIEGGEQELFRADLSWLERVRCLVLELHADRVDWWEIIATLERAGFAQYSLGTGNHYRGPTDLMAAFRRPY